MNKFYQYHESKGYSARVTIEWGTPRNYEMKLKEAEEIANEILAFSGPKMRDIVKKMMGN